MKGKGCVAIAADRRFGIQTSTLNMDFQRIFDMGPHLYIGLPGLATDTLTVHERLRFRMNLYELRENRKIKPQTFSAMVSNLLYERRFGPYFVEPVIAGNLSTNLTFIPKSVALYLTIIFSIGLDPVTWEPFISAMDLIGCPNMPEDFVVAGTCAEQLFGMCEALWEPNLEPEDLFETISQALMNAFDRDAISGWGGIVHIM